jgi:hypothetical protein
MEAIMATTESINPRPSDQGCCVLIVPHGATRSRRIIVPHEVAQWLHDELGKALSEMEADHRRAARRASKGGH